MIPISEFEVGQIWSETPKYDEPNFYKVVDVDRPNGVVKILWLGPDHADDVESHQINSFNYGRDALLTPAEVADLMLAL